MIQGVKKAWVWVIVTGVNGSNLCETLRSHEARCESELKAEGISRLHCCWPIADVVSHHLCSVVIHSGHRWPLRTNGLSSFKTEKVLDER